MLTVTPTTRKTFRPTTRAVVLAKYGNCCAYCGHEITNSTMHIDHIVARQLGGSNAFENLNPCCRACNSFKGVWSLEEFRATLEAQVKQLRRYSSAYRLAERFMLVKQTETRVTFHFERVTGGEG